MDGGLKIHIWVAGQNYESSHLGSSTEDPVLGVEGMAALCFLKTYNNRSSSFPERLELIITGYFFHLNMHI